MVFLLYLLFILGIVWHFWRFCTRVYYRAPRSQTVVIIWKKLVLYRLICPDFKLRLTDLVWSWFIGRRLPWFSWGFRREPLSFVIDNLNIDHRLCRIVDPLVLAILIFVLLLGGLPCSSHLPSLNLFVLLHRISFYSNVIKKVYIDSISVK